MDYIDVTRAFGVTTLILSIGFLCHLGHYKEMARKMVGKPAGFILGGVFPVLVGSLVLNFHQEWVLGWGLTLTIIGWTLFLIGVFRIWFVHIWIHLIKKYIKLVPVLFAVFGLMFGMLLCYAGFIVPLYR